MPVAFPSNPIGRRPYHTTLDFENETQPAVIEQLVRGEFISRQGLVRGKRVLDVGCGSGYTAHFLVERGGAVAVTGLEIDRGLVAENNRRNTNASIQFLGYDGGPMPFDNGTFDVVTCFEVLEHLRSEQQRNIIEEISRVVTPNGLAILSTPNRPVYSPDGVSLNPDHINELNEDELRYLCGECFRSVELYGQRVADSGSLRVRQRRHCLSHSAAGKLLRCLKVPVLLRRMYKRRNCRPYSVARSDYEIHCGIDSQSVVQLAMCRCPSSRTMTG